MNSTIFLTYLCILIGSNFEEVNVENNSNLLLCIDKFLVNDTYDQALPYDKIYIKDKKHYKNNIYWMFKYLPKGLSEIFLIGCSGDFNLNNDLNSVKFNDICSSVSKNFKVKLKKKSYKICKTYCVKCRNDFIFALYNYKKGRNLYEKKNYQKLKNKNFKVSNHENYNIVYNETRINPNYLKYYEFFKCLCFRIKKSLNNMKKFCVADLQTILNNYFLNEIEKKYFKNNKEEYKEFITFFKKNIVDQIEEKLNERFDIFIESMSLRNYLVLE